MPTSDRKCRLVIFGASNIISELFECALATGLVPTKVVLHLPEGTGDRDIPVAKRAASLAPHCAPPVVQSLDDFAPEPDEVYILGPTTPTRATLAALLTERFRMAFHTLVHPTAYVSRLATLGPGVFVGANSVIASGAVLAEHVFVNRGATIGHDTKIGAFSRIQPGSNVGGLSQFGRGVTVGIGATLVERLVIGDNVVIAAGAVVLRDVPADVLVAGVPATIRKSLV